MKIPLKHFIGGRSCRGRCGGGNGLGTLWTAMIVTSITAGGRAEWSGINYAVLYTYYMEERDRQFRKWLFAVL